MASHHRKSRNLHQSLSLDTKSARPNQKFYLLDLSGDIHQLIVAQLQVSDPLFVPGPQGGDWYNVFKRKSMEYYGQPKKDHVACGKGLLNWSTTCHYFRELITPVLFKDIVLRSKPKSIESIKELSQGPYWQHVKSLVFVGSDGPETSHARVSNSEDRNNVEEPTTQFRTNNTSCWRERSKLQGLFDILPKLPPNLESLTLDFCQHQHYQTMRKLIADNIGFDFLESFQQTLAVGWDRALYYTCQIVHAVCQNDISCKHKFELKLYNVPSSLDPPWNSLRAIMKNVTSFTISLDHLHEELQESEELEKAVLEEEKWPLISRLRTMFFDNLPKVETLNIYADHAWYIGLGPGSGNVRLQFPLTRKPCILPKVNHIMLQHVLLCDNLLKFLLSRADTLESLELKNCAVCVHKDHHSLDWARFFTSLANRAPSQLTHFKIRNCWTKECWRSDGVLFSGNDIRTELAESLNLQLILKSVWLEQGKLMHQGGSRRSSDIFGWTATPMSFPRIH